MHTHKDKSFINVCVIYLVVMVLFILWRMVAGAWLYDGGLDERYSDIIFSIITQIGIMFLLPFLGLKFLKRKPTQPLTFSDFMQDKKPEPGIFRSWAFNKPGPKVIAFAVGLGILMFFFNIFVSSFFNGILSILGHRGAARGGESSDFSGILGLLVALTMTAVLPGFCEEVAHRGMLLRGFESRLGILRGIMLASLLFGFMHLNIVQCFYAAILGYLMGLAVVATRTIWTAIIMHFLNNGISVYLMFAGQNHWVGGDLLTHFGNFFGNASFFVYLLCFMGLFFLIVTGIYVVALGNFIRDNNKLDQPRPLTHKKGMQAIRYYITYGEVKNHQPLSALEKTLLYGIIFLGGLVTTMTLVWGFL
ncbi:MAG: CPBP family intramembrane metalloprotease [Christensenellaceae bacterium]|jgi:membrane protease YdiL (CAAX protease family)|nr:CPBP family intramembrane metalloprotease [Christensenellaceae bacterium]